MTDSDLKYVWMLEKTEVRKIRAGCEHARLALGIQTVAKQAKALVGFGADHEATMEIKARAASVAARDRAEALAVKAQADAKVAAHVTLTRLPPPVPVF